MIGSLDYQTNVFHVGICVPDVEEAQAEHGELLGLEWAPVVEREQTVWTQRDGSYTLPLRFTYSGEGPQHVELLQGPAGSPWDGATDGGLHHVGFWSDDVAADTERFIAAGWTLVLAGASPEDGYGSMSYVRSPSGLVVEPVTAAARPRLEQWWAGNPWP